MVGSGGLRSHLLAGTVRHRRDAPAVADFTHRVWYLAVDIDELDAVDARLRLLSRRRHNLLELRDADHLERGHAGIAAAMRQRLEELELGGDVEAADLRLTLVTYPRVLGYVFNPVSFYLGHDAGGVLLVVFAEVHNTHGDREVYAFLPEAVGATVFRSAQGKRMYVSPFVAPDAEYTLLVTDDAGRLAITIRVDEDGRQVLFTRLDVARRPLTDGQLLRVLARDPLVPLKTTALIFWHAVRLRLRGVPWQRYRRPARAK